MGPAAYVRTVFQLVEIKVRSISIRHQCAFEVTKEVLDGFLLAVTKQIVTDLRCQVDQNPHVTLLVMDLAIGFRHLGVNPGLVTIEGRPRLQQPKFDDFLTVHQELSTTSQPIKYRSLGHAHFFIDHAVHLAPACQGILETVHRQV